MVQEEKESFCSFDIHCNTYINLSCHLQIKITKQTQKIKVNEKNNYKASFNQAG